MVHRIFEWKDMESNIKYALCLIQFLNYYIFLIMVWILIIHCNDIMHVWFIYSNLLI